MSWGHVISTKASLLNEKQAPVIRGPEFSLVDSKLLIKNPFLRFKLSLLNGIQHVNSTEILVDLKVFQGNNN